MHQQNRATKIQKVVTYHTKGHDAIENDIILAGPNLYSGRASGGSGALTRGKEGKKKRCPPRMRAASTTATTFTRTGMQPALNKGITGLSGICLAGMAASGNYRTQIFDRGGVALRTRSKLAGPGDVP